MTLCLLSTSLKCEKKKRILYYFESLFRNIFCEMGSELNHNISIDRHFTVSLRRSQSLVVLFPGCQVDYSHPPICLEVNVAKTDELLQVHTSLKNSSIFETKTVDVSCWKPLV